MEIESGIIFYADLNCSGAQLISFFFNEKSYLKDLNLDCNVLVEKKDEIIINDYYLGEVNRIFEEVGEKTYEDFGYKIKGKIKDDFKNFSREKLRKIFKNIIMTINYGLTRLGLL
jgi:hypothetical protein